MKKKIRTENGINETEDLILYEVEHSVEGFNIPIIEYVLFTEDGKTQLDLNTCDNLKAQYYIPVSINEDDIDKHDPSSEFYNDECNKHSTEDGVDMTLYERKNEFNNNNMAVCEKGCTFIGFDSDTKKVQCDCNIKSDMNYYNQDTKKEDLLDKVETEKKSSNLKVTACANNAFSSPKSLFTNSGFITLTIILIAFIIIFIIFCIKGKHLLENKIDEVIYNKFDKQEKDQPKKELKNSINPSNKIHPNGNISENQEKYIKKKRKKKGKKELIDSKINSKNNFINIKNGNNLDLINENNIQNYNYKEKIITKEDIGDIQIEEKPDKENDYEMNTLIYIIALKYDNRTGCDYYSSQLKNKQLFLFTFCSFND